jgi:Transketolase, N-terminal subunit
MLDTETLKELKDRAFDIRVNTIRTIASFGSGHIGGSMSIAELLSVLYFNEMNIDPADPQKKDRDRFVCSKGHAGPAVYSALALKGFFPEEWLSTLNQGGTKLPSHCDMTKTPGIDFTGGSLGQGFSAAVGIALGQKIQKIDAYTYAVVGDGESQEGEVWEAAETAGAWHLENLIAFTDKNNQQLDGYTSDIIPMDDLASRYLTFGWNVYSIDGQSIPAIYYAIEEAKANKNGKPTMIVLNTRKSYGYIPGEGKKANHSMPISKEAAEEAINALKLREGR